METLKWAIVVPAQSVLTQVGQFVANLFLVLFLILVGWLISKFVVKVAVTKILQVFKIDDIGHKVELDKILAKGGVTTTLSELIGEVCYWIAILTTFVVAFNAVGLTIAAELLQRIVLYVPNIVAAVFILIVGMFSSAILKNIVTTAAGNAGISQGHLLARLAEIVVMVFAVAIALEQLQIGARIVELTISIVLASLGLGFALAFGLGCKDMVGKSAEEFMKKLKK